MSEERKSNKRKNITRYLVLAACILVLAAVTVIVIFAANGWFKTDVNIEVDGGDSAGNNGGELSGGDNAGEQGGDTAATPPPQGEQGGNTADGNDDKPVANPTGFACPVETVDVINCFDFGRDVTLGHYHFHTGLDMAGEVGAAVIACLDGTVESIVVNDQLDGTTVTLLHDNGIKTVYSFIDAVEGLKEGDRVKRGEKIGSIAEPAGKEFKEGAHLHFEVYENGTLKDPEGFLDVSSK